MATASEDNLFFYEDEVFRVNSKGVIQFGTVIENSELVSSDDETSDDEYDSSDYKIKKGHIRVSWHPSGLTQVLSESKVGLADRSLMPGDVVKMLAADKNTQRGYCNNIKVYATVQIVGTQQVIENIPTSQLSPLSKFTKDLAVYLDHWVGVIRDVHIKLLIACSDGSRAYISDSNTLKALLSRQGLGNYKSADDDDSPRMGKPDFYPGQALVAPRFILNSAVTGWQNKSPEFDRLVSRSKSLNVKVEAVEVDYVEVAWRCTAYTGNSVDPREPIVKGEELGRLCVLNHFESATNEVGDRATYVVTSEDVVTSLDSWRERKKEKLAEESGRRLPVQHTRRKGSRRKLKKSKQESGLPALPTTLASYPNQDPSEQEMPLCPLGGDSSDPTRIEEDSSQQSTISNPANDLNSTLVAKDQAAQSSSVALESECCNGTLVSSVELEDKCSNETLVPVQAGNEQDVPLILLDVASDSEDCWEWTTDEEDYYSGDDSTSCCTTYTGTSVATSSITALTNSEPSLQAPLGQDETGAPTTSESSAVAGTGAELTPRPKRRVLTWTTRLSRLRNKKKSRRGGAGNKLKALPCRGGAEVED
uniref:(E3-independent) E2 ubiquitin-conjugating enzyme UBE2O n=1 Tax=Cacopsylla melanoneura TaxID=428564 RepID=A0A8D8YZ56_9HEMI